MKRRRMLEHDIWRNDKFGSLSMPAKLLFIGMITMADDDGRLKASPNYLKANIFPYESVNTEDVKKYRQECVDFGLVICYQNGACDYVSLNNWNEHQTIRTDLYKESKLPEPPSNTIDTIRNTRVTTTSQKRNTHVTESQHNIIEDNISKEKKRRRKEEESSSNLNNLFGDICKLLEDEKICRLTDITRQEIGELIDKFGKFENGYYIKEAIKEASVYNKRSLKYVQTILDSWYTEGRKSKDGREPPLWQLEGTDE